MHDLLNDLTKYVYGETCFRLGVDNVEGQKVPKTTRHFSTTTEPTKYNEYRSLCEAKALRTFITIGDFGNSIHELISNFKFLRLLSLSRCWNIKEVLGVIVDFIHLRSIDLSFTNTNRLPNSICSLYNLQVLMLNKCPYLKKLPSTLHELTKLRRLELMGTSLRKAPVLLGKLKNLLQVWISKFEVDKSSSELSVQQLGDLDLYGKLTITNLQNIRNPCDALTADLKNKIHLVGLDLKWNLKLNNDESVKEREVLENLDPSSHLKHLSISVYCGRQFECGVLKLV